MADYGAGGSQQVPENEPDTTAEGADSAAPDGAPTPWYRNRVLLALWALMVALLLTLVIYGIVELSRGGGETSGPATTTSSTTPTRSSTTSPTTTPSTTHRDTAATGDARADTRRGAAAGEQLPRPGRAAATSSSPHPVDNHIAAHGDYAAARILSRGTL